MQKPGLMPSFCPTDLSETTTTVASDLRLRLRLQSGIRIGARTRLAGGRHRGSTRSCRLEHRLAVRLLALPEIHDLVSGERFIFQKTLGESFQIGALLRQNFGCLLIAFFNQALDLAVDLLNRRLRR